jgi:hypothetical protein
MVLKKKRRWDRLSTGGRSVDSRLQLNKRWCAVCMGFSGQLQCGEGNLFIALVTKITWVRPQIKVNRCRQSLCHYIHSASSLYPEACSCKDMRRITVFRLTMDPIYDGGPIIYYSCLEDRADEAIISSIGCLIISFEVCASANTSSMFRRT